MHIPPHDNRNEPIIAPGNDRVPLNYFNIVKLREGESFDYRVPGVRDLHRSCDRDH